jgi:hypothetical protein
VAAVVNAMNGPSVQNRYGRASFARGDHQQAQLLLVFTASPGTEGYEKLKLLSVIGTQS